MLIRTLLATFVFGYVIGIGVGLMRVDADAAPLVIAPGYGAAVSSTAATTSSRSVRAVRSL